MTTETLSTSLVESLESFPEILVAYLFGSQARGTPHRESDVDLGVLLDRSQHPSPRSRFDVGLRLAGRMEAKS